VIEQIIHWAKEQKPIRTVILVGSRAPGGAADVLSDYDLAIFCDDNSQYIRDDQWLSEIGNVWICVHEKVIRDGKEFPTRLVIFEGGYKVDFAFYPIDLLQKLVSSTSLPSEYNMGYSILLDKDDTAANMPKPSLKGKIATKPTEKEFQNIVKEFWFETYHVAVYLKREDLWSAKVRQNGIHENFLLKMIEWNEQCKHNWEISIPHEGKKMHSWVSESTWNALIETFGRFDEQEGWDALLKTVILFRDLAKETALSLQYQYPDAMDWSISSFILQLRRLSYE
jgi:aminoglycoside 6-adenylyltransferase